MAFGAGLTRGAQPLTHRSIETLRPAEAPSVTAFAPNGFRIDRCRPSLNGAHGVALGPEGAIYLAEIEPCSVTKLTRA
jgi:hypothetical protein